MFTQNTTVRRSDPVAQPASHPAERSPSLAAYAARRSYAFDVAEAAYWDGAICAEAYMLFRLLTRLCKDRTCCWPGLDYLAQQLQTSVGTIKRRLERLERAQLIERRQRPGGLTSYTYVLPLRDYDAAEADRPAEAARDTADQATTQSAAPKARASKSAGRVRTPTSDHAPALFFVPPQQISAAPTDRSALIPQTIKSQPLNPGGGGREEVGNSEAADPVVTALQHGGVLSPVVLHELRQMPLPEVEACLSFARQQRNIADPVAFAVSLLRQGLGPKLAARACSRPEQPRSASLAAASGSERRYGAAAAASSGSGCEQPATAHTTVWQAVLARLKPALSDADFAAWLSDTALVQLEQRQAVVATPNVFVRDRIGSVYQSLIAEALHGLTGQTVTVELVIGAA